MPFSGHTGFAPLTGVCAFPVYIAQAPGCSIWSRPCVECSSSFRVLHKSVDSVAPACCVFPASAVQAARGLALSPRALRAFFLRGPSLRHRSGLGKHLDRNPGPFAVWEGVASLGLSLPLCPPRCLLPPAGMGWFFSGVSQSLCFANRRRCVPAG